MVDSTAKPPLLHITTQLGHNNGSGSSFLSGIHITDNVSKGLQAYWDGNLKPSLATPGFAFPNRQTFNWDVNSSLGNGQTKMF